MKKFLKEFREFAARGNVIDLAVGVIMGGAFGKIVTSLVEDLIMPPIGVLIGGVNFADLSITLKDASVDSNGTIIEAVTWNYGNFIQLTFNFLIVALAIFLLIKAINKLKREDEKKQEIKEEKKVEKSAQVKLLEEIRDLLKDSNS